MKDIVVSRQYAYTLDNGDNDTGKPKSMPEIKVDFGMIQDVVKKLHDRPNVIHPTGEEIKEMAEKYGTKTKFNNYNFVSTVKNRSAGLTVYIGSDRVRQPSLNPRQIEIIKNLPKTMDDVIEYIKKAPLVCTERYMGDNPYFTPHCTLYVSTHRKEMIRLAHMVNQTLAEPSTESLAEPSEESLAEPLTEIPGGSNRGKHIKECLIYIPEWQEKDRQILVFPEIGVTFVLGTDYYGEAKKAFLRMAMWFSKEDGMLGLHAGAKIIKARDSATDKIKKYSMILFGLTATGKTTHSCHDHDLTGNDEGIEIVQDDVIFLRDDCSAIGSERGFYLKTEGVTPAIQPLIYNAITKPDAVFENVVVDYKGDVYFGDETLTGNGRGIMQRNDFGKFKSDSVNLPSPDELDGMIIAFITRRNTVVPIASKLTLDQAAAAFMLGESIETSASNPKRAGESVREVGTNPFIVGNLADEGNRFYEFIKKYPEKIQCYLLNTGGVGEIMEKDEEGNKVVRQKVLRVEIPEMASIIRGIARGTIDWKEDPNFGTMVPSKVEGADMSKFDLDKFYTQDQIDDYVATLKEERIEWLKKFPGLDLGMVRAIEE